ncbi:MAG: hypothetical protein IJ306_02940 [Oscillospiraceae bacterium]|nr:hypothetical protein [Oscillospiraceae bacterium]
MKKLFALVMSFVFILSGCDIKNPHSDELPIKEELIEASAEKAVIKIANLVETDCFYDDTYLLKRNGENGWETAEMKGDTREIFTREESVINAGETVTLTVDFSAVYGTLSPGEYRLYKEIWFVDENGEKEYGEILLNFTVEENKQSSDPQEDPNIITVTVAEVSEKGISLVIKNIIAKIMFLAKNIILKEKTAIAGKLFRNLTASFSLI